MAFSEQSQYPGHTTRGTTAAPVVIFAAGTKRMVRLWLGTNSAAVTITITNADNTVTYGVFRFGTSPTRSIEFDLEVSDGLRIASTAGTASAGEYVVFEPVQ